MNRNSNVYTVIYATVLTVLVAILLSAASLGLKDKQKANTDNEKKQQILQSVASKLGKEVTFENAADLWQELKMDDAMFCVNTKGEKVDGKAFDIASKSLFSAGKIIPEATLPVYVANINGVPYRIMSMYGAGLWGPIWGYMSFETDLKTIGGAYFDHESETAGLGARIKDDPSFQAEFVGEVADFSSANVFEIVKGGAPKEADGKSTVDNKIDAISGATMTSQGLDAAIDTWLEAYAKYFVANKPAKEHCGKCGHHHEAEEEVEPKAEED